MATESYEKCWTELEKIMQDFEDKDLSLDKSLSNYDKALKLIKKMQNILDEAEGKLKEIQENNK